MISVIIPVYNRPELIGETLGTVWSQTLPDYEVIVVDDGSTPEVARELLALRPRITYLRIDHSGQATARNAGLNVARGEYIAFLDSDDLWDVRFLEEMQGALQTNPTAGFAYCDYSTFDEKGTRDTSNLLAREKNGGHIFGALLESDFLCTGAVLFRRECFGHAGIFDRRLPPVEDWDLWLRIAREYEAVCVDEPLVRIRLNPSGASRNPAIVYSLNLQVLAKLQRDFPSEMRRFQPLIRRQAVRFHRALVDYYRVNRRPLPALKHLALMATARYWG